MAFKVFSLFARGSCKIFCTYDMFGGVERVFVVACLHNDPWVFWLLL